VAESWNTHPAAACLRHLPKIGNAVGGPGRCGCISNAALDPPGLLCVRSVAYRWFDVSALPLVDRKALLETLVADKPASQFNAHETGDGELFLKHAGKPGFEGVVSKRINAPYTPRNRGLGHKAKWLNRQEFVIVGWSDPEGSRPHLGALLLAYYTDDGELIYAGRVGTGMPVRVLADLRRQLDPLARKTSPMNIPPSRKTRFGSPLILSRVHWVEPLLVAEITYLTWTADNLLRHTVYVGLRDDKPAKQVRREG
jgi:ATP-dependent DNA ligase